MSDICNTENQVPGHLLPVTAPFPPQNISNNLQNKLPVCRGHHHRRGGRHTGCSHSHIEKIIEVAIY